MWGLTIYIYTHLFFGGFGGFWWGFLEIFDGSFGVYFSPTEPENKNAVTRLPRISLSV